MVSYRAIPIFTPRVDCAKRQNKKAMTSTSSIRRFVITTPITMNNTTWDIQLTLTDRSNMTYLMLLGREAMQDRFVVDPSIEYILGRFVTEEK